MVDVLGSWVDCAKKHQKSGSSDAFTDALFTVFIGLESYDDVEIPVGIKSIIYPVYQYV